MDSSDSMNSRLSSVIKRIQAASSSLVPPSAQLPQLVAVSKTKPVEDIVEAYSCGQRHFGENYIAELVAKAQDRRIVNSCPEIKWHFIGTLQSNKVNMLCRTQNLYAVQSIYSRNLAQKVNQAWAKYAKNSNRLKVYVQVNTSGDVESTKSGCPPSDVLGLAIFIREKCPVLELSGLMTIGSAANSLAASENLENPDFTSLNRCRDQLRSHYNKDGFSQSLGLSMGMSADFEAAILQGATTVRVGSVIFGQRNYPNQPKPVVHSSTEAAEPPVVTENEAETDIPADSISAEKQEPITESRIDIEDSESYKAITKTVKSAEMPKNDRKIWRIAAKSLGFVLLGGVAVAAALNFEKLNKPKSGIALGVALGLILLTDSVL